MKRIILLLVLCSSIGFSQSNHEDGPYKEHYSNGQLKREGFYRGLHKIAAWKDYYKTGALKRVYLYDGDGKFTGIEKQYSKEGGLEKETLKVSNGSLVAKHYYDSGNLRALYAFFPPENSESGDKNGSCREYYENGGIKIESFYKDDKLSGIWKQFYATGELAWEVEYTKGTMHGVYKEFFKNGTLKTKGNVNYGFPEGTENRYDDLGNLIWSGAYEKGVFNGEWINYDSEGNQLNVLKFKEGQLKKPKANIHLEITKIPEDSFTTRSAIYPGCENETDILGLKKCMADNISKFIDFEFNTGVIAKDVLKSRVRINIIFKVDDEGNVTDVRARAPHPALETEAIRVLNLLPKLKPGMYLGKPVTIPYSLPVVIDGINKDNGVSEFR